MALRRNITRVACSSYGRKGFSFLLEIENNKVRSRCLGGQFRFIHGGEKEEISQLELEKARRRFGMSPEQQRKAIKEDQIGAHSLSQYSGNSDEEVEFSKLSSTDLEMDDGTPRKKKCAQKKKGKDAVDYNAIWDDYIGYMDHQRTKGWKS